MNISNSFLRETLENNLLQILRLYLDKKIDDEKVLAILNTATHHVYSAAQCLFEMFFVEALKINNIPNNKYIISALFSDMDRKLFVYPDSAYVVWDSHLKEYTSVEFKKGTRLKVLEAVQASKSILLYKKWITMTENNPEFPQSHRETSFDINHFWNTLREELPENTR